MTKVMPLSQAISRFVQDGNCIYAAGFTHLIPFAAGHEIIRQKRKELTLARATPDLIYDQMVAAGCARKVIFSYMGNPGVGSLRIVRAEIEAGRLEWEEYSHFGMISRLQAGATGVPFMPMNPTAAGDLSRANPLHRTVIDPYSGGEVAVVPALQPDVAIVHVQRADAAEGSGFRCPARDPDGGGNCRCLHYPFRSKPDIDTGFHRGCRVSRAILCPPILYPGIL